MDDKKNITELLVSDIYSLKDVLIPESVKEKVKECFLDYIGVTVAGAKLLKERNSKIISLLSNDGNSSVLIGYRKRSSLLDSILVNNYQLV